MEDIELCTPKFFTRMAASYSHSTANTTLTLFTQTLIADIQPSANAITSSSVVHNNAAGPGIATAAFLEVLSVDAVPKEILVSDNTPAMVAGARDSLAAYPRIACKELDSQNLTSVSDGKFSHSICNFSIFTFPDPEAAMRETYRTLQPGGLAVITCWGRFPPAMIVHATQKKIRPDLPPMPVPGLQFLQKGELARVLAKGGFAADKTQVLRKTFIVKSEDGLAGLQEHLNGPLMKKAKEGFTEDDEEKWRETVGKVVQDEIAEYGGIKFDAYTALATKASV